MLNFILLSLHLRELDFASARHPSNFLAKKGLLLNDYFQQYSYCEFKNEFTDTKLRFSKILCFWKQVEAENMIIPLSIFFSGILKLATTRKTKFWLILDPIKDPEILNNFFLLIFV